MKRSKVVIGIFVALILVVLTIVLLAFTVFIVRDVEVNAEVNSRLIDEEKIVESSGLTKGTNIISINKSKIKAKIEKDNPYIEITKIVREFPSKVVISATVRTGIMLVYSEDGTTAAVIDSSMKILNVVSAADASKTGVTTISGLTYKVPQEGALSAVGSVATFTNESCGTVLKEIAEAAKDSSLDVGGASFKTLFTKIEFITGEGITVHLVTNRGVALVLDTTLSSTIFEQLYKCLLTYTNKMVDMDPTYGYILLDKESTPVAYKWVPSLD